MNSYSGEFGNQNFTDLKVAKAINKYLLSFYFKHPISSKQLDKMFIGNLKKIS